MIIRDAQLEAFRTTAVLQYEAGMVEHLAAFAPELARVAGKPGLQAIVHTGVERAAAYGFTNRGPVQLYLELMCSLGADFNGDPQYPWALAALSDAQTPDQTRRASRIYRGAMEYFDKTAGPGDVHSRAALAKAFEADGLVEQSAGDLGQRILAGFHSCYPQ